MTHEYEITFVVQTKDGKVATNSGKISSVNYFGALAISWLNDEINPTSSEADVLAIRMRRLPTGVGDEPPKTEPCETAKEALRELHPGIDI